MLKLHNVLKKAK